MRNLWIGFMFILAFMSTTFACTPGEKVVAGTVLDIGGAICEELPTQDEPAWLKFTCTVVESGAPRVFMAKVQRTDAPALAAMRAKKCPAVVPSSVPTGRVTP